MPKWDAKKISLSLSLSLASNKSKTNKNLLAYLCENKKLSCHNHGGIALQCAVYMWFFYINIYMCKKNICSHLADHKTDPLRSYYIKIQILP